MNRYRAARRRPVNPTAGPLLAFLLIASFGLLFVTGCSSVRGPDAQERMEDDTFTTEDIARFRELSGASDASAMSSVTDVGSLMPTGTGSQASADPALRKKYDDIRSSTSQGGNAYRVVNEFLNVRAAASVSAPFVQRLNQGDRVQVKEFIDGAWAKIQMPDGKDGFISTRYIAKVTSEERLKEEQKQFEGTYFVNFTFLNVRQTPDAGSEKIGELPGQAFVKPLSMDKDWARVVVDGKEGYASMQYLSPFRPTFLVRQDRFQLPIFHYRANEPGMLEALLQHAARLKQDGDRLLTFRDLHDTVMTQEVRDVRIPPRAAIVAVSGLTADNIKKISDALVAASVPATLFIQGDQLGLSAINEKTLLTVMANGFDIQSAGHTGDNLSTLTDAQTKLELEQSRKLLEDLTHKSVFAVAYPQGGANDRVLRAAADAGYLFGMSSAPESAFTRDQFLRLPSITITPGMTADDVAKLVK